MGMSRLWEMATEASTEARNPPELKKHRLSLSLKGKKQEKGLPFSSRFIVVSYDDIKICAKGICPAST